MKVITESKCLDTIKLSDVDMDSHYVVVTNTMGRCPRLLIRRSGNIETVWVDGGFYWGGASCRNLDTYVREYASNEILHAFKTLDEALNFIQECTHND